MPAVLDLTLTSPHGFENVFLLFGLVCMYGFYGAYNCSGLARQVSGLIIVTVGAQGIWRILDFWIKGWRKGVS